MELIKSETYHNLAKSYAGECMARTRYEFMEYGARKEGYKNIADIIDRIVYQEFNHARMFYTFIETANEGVIKNIDITSGYPFKEKWNLLDNLMFAAEDEEYEEKKIYPAYAKIAMEEGFKDIAGLWNNLVQVESCHKKTFLDLYDQMKNGTLYSKPMPIKWKCMDCGYEHTDKKGFTECPICQAKQGSILLQLKSE